MKRFLIILFVQSAVCLAQQPIEMDLWPGGAPESNGLAKNERGEDYSIAKLYVYRPDQQKNTRAAVVICPGGGYAGLAMNHEGHDMASWFNTQGITLVVLKYRMPNGHHDVPLSDAEQAMRIVRQHAKEWQLNPDKIGVMGASAGGHLAATLATRYSSADVRPDFQILLYPVINMKNGSPALLGQNPSDELMTKYSPDLQVKINTPPAFITVSSDDRLVPHSILYYQALLEKKVSACLHAYSSGGHGWGFRDDFLYKRQWTEELEKWLRIQNKLK